MTPRQWTVRLRRITLLLVLLMGAWMVWRFDRVRLPETGCSPLASVAAGDLLLVDRHPSSPAIGTALFVEVHGHVYLVRLRERDAAGRLWVRTEVSDCPGTDSEDFGWLEPEAVVGRVLVAWTW